MTTLNNITFNIGALVDVQRLICDQCGEGNWTYTIDLLRTTCEAIDDQVEKLAHLDVLNTMNSLEGNNDD